MTCMELTERKGFGNSHFICSLEHDKRKDASTGHWLEMTADKQARLLLLLAITGWLTKGQNPFFNTAQIPLTMKRSESHKLKCYMFPITVLKLLCLVIFSNTSKYSPHSYVCVVLM